ncbi:MAG: hypothetical protein K6G13_10530, partial [Agathobacter sp.]|uniref:hypothetical protein n=1 Tax=Agathobacter sp. TaxID=2021311 RepID=UPI002586A41F
MKTKMILIAFCMMIMFCMSACSGNTVKTRSRVLRAGFGSASADKFLSESVRILAERLTQSELVPRLSIVCH